MLDLLAKARAADRILLETFVCTRTGRERNFRRIIESATVARAQQWRHALASSNARGERGYVCPACGGRLTLVLRLPNRFHLRHIDKHTTCPLQDDRRRARYMAEVDYARAVESEEHRQMCADLAAALVADPAFTNVNMGRLFSGRREGWRQPDLNAEWQGQRVAFELQLSSTYLDALVRRRLVYRERQIPMLWLMREFDPYDPKLPQADTVTELDGLAICLDDAALAASREAGELRLHAVQYVWHSRRWERRLVGMQDLTLSLPRATVSLAQPPVPEPDTDDSAHARVLVAELVELQSRDRLGRHPSWNRLLELFPQVHDSIKAIGWADMPNPWFLRLCGAVMMGDTGEVHGFTTPRLQHAADVLAQNSWEVFATLILVLREHGHEERLYAEAGGEGIRKKAAHIRQEWKRAPRGKFKTKMPERELARLIWPEFSELIVEPPSR